VKKSASTDTLRHIRLDKIKKHSNTNEHKESELMLLNSDQNESNRDNTEQLNEEKSLIISLMKNIYFCSKNNISLNVYPNLCSLVSLQIRNNISDKISTLKPASLEKQSKPKSKYGSYKNPISGCDFLDSIASMIKNSLFEELNSSHYWSIMIDEANSIDDKHLAIVGKYIANNMPIMKYLGLIDLKTTDSENIYNKIKLFCISNEITYQNIIHFGSDGASNMTGYKSGIAARFKKINPFISSNHCISHRLHLAGKDASDEVFYFQKYEKTLQEIYGYFSRSYTRQNILKLMQVINYFPNYSNY